MIQLIVSLYVFCNIDYRSVVDTVGVINQILCLGFEKILAYTTVKTWLEKCGLDSYKRSLRMFRDKNYSIIFDESMVMGGVKLLLTLVAREECKASLNAGDVRIVDIYVASNHKGEDVKAGVCGTMEKIGKKSAVAHTYNGASVTYAISESGITNLLDVGHKYGMFMDRIFMDDVDFCSFTKELGLLKSWENMKANMFLQPPTQRAKQRFKNISFWVMWGMEK